MAHFRPILGQLSGKLAGNIFATGANGATCRARSMQVNPRRPAQLLARQRLASNAASWRSLTSTQRADWATYALTVPKTNPLGETYYASGFALFMAANSLGSAIGLTPFADAPTTPGAAASPVLVDQTSIGFFHTPGDEANLGLFWSLMGASFYAYANASDGGGALVAYSALLSKGITFYNGPWHTTYKAVWPSTSSTELTTAFDYATPFGTPLSVRIAAIDGEGRLAPPASIVATYYDAA